MINAIVNARGFGAGVVTDEDGEGLVRVSKKSRDVDPSAPGVWMRTKDVDVIAL